MGMWIILGDLTFGRRCTTLKITQGTKTLITIGSTIRLNLRKKARTIILQLSKVDSENENAEQNTEEERI
jgi:hypothetical protein